jgi:hypothetical protein
MPSQKTKHDGLLSGVPGEAFVQGAEGPVVQGPLSGGTECAKPGGTNCIGSVVQEISSLGGMGTRGEKVAAVQFGGSKIDQDQYALSTCSIHARCAIRSAISCCVQPSWRRYSRSGGRLASAATAEHLPANSVRLPEARKRHVRRYRAQGGTARMTLRVRATN